MYKQIIIARKDLNMSPGKLAAQVAHASMAFLSWMIRDNIDIHSKQTIADGEKCEEPKCWYTTKPIEIEADLYDQWLFGAYTKTVLQARNKSQLLKATVLAGELGMKEGIDYFIIKDNCYTELEPEEIDGDGIGKTITCIGFKPMDSEIIDWIGKKYHLYV